MTTRRLDGVSDVGTVEAVGTASAEGAAGTAAAPGTTGAADIPPAEGAAGTLPPTRVGLAALAAAGAGLVAVALGAERVGSGVVWVVALALPGAVATTWGLAALARGRAPAGRTAAAVLVTAAAVWLLGRTYEPGTGAVSGAPVGAADVGLCLLLLAAGLGAALDARAGRGTLPAHRARRGAEARAGARRATQSRAGAGRGRPARTGRPTFRLLGWAASALAVAAVATPAMAATEAGRHAVPHHGTVPAVEEHHDRSGDAGSGHHDDVGDAPAERAPAERAPAEREPAGHGH